MEKSIEAIPTWALCYLVNGDQSGLTADEIKLIDDAIQRDKISDVIPAGEDSGTEPYFSSFPLFGPPAEVEDCVVIFKN